MTRLLAVGDLHLGQGVERYGPQRLQDQADVWARIADLAIDEGVDAVLLAGDAFERRRYPSQAELIAFAEPLARLHREGIDVVGIAGNHDVLTVDGPTSLDIFRGRMSVANQPRVVNVPGASIACLPWTPISRLVAERNGGDRDALYAEAAVHLHTIARGLRELIADGPAVLLAHWSVSGAVTPTGREVGLDFGVVLDAAELESQGWDAVVVGHIHKAQMLNVSHDDFRESGPMFYTGSPLPLNFGEADVEHGVWILNVDEATSTRFVPIESRPFVTLDARPCSAQDVAEGSAGLSFDTLPIRDSGAIVRVRYTATEEQNRRVQAEAIRRALIDDMGAWHVLIEPEILREDRARVHVDSEALTELDALNLWLESQGVNGMRGAQMIERTAAYLERRA